MIWLFRLKILQSLLSPFLSYPMANPTTASYFQCYHNGLPSSPPGLLQHLLTSLPTFTLAPQVNSPPNSQNDRYLHHILLLFHSNSPRGSIPQESQYFTMAYQALMSPPRCPYGLLPHLYSDITFAGTWPGHPQPAWSSSPLLIFLQVLQVTISHAV